MIASNDKDMIIYIKKYLAESFEMEDLGNVKKYIGIEFYQDVKVGETVMTQKGCILLILKRLGMENCKPTNTPLELNSKLEKPLQPDFKIMQKLTYQSLIGALMYLAVNTRPNIAYAVNFLNQFNSNYGTEH